MVKTEAEIRDEEIRRQDAIQTTLVNLYDLDKRRMIASWVEVAIVVIVFVFTYYSNLREIGIGTEGRAILAFKSLWAVTSGFLFFIELTLVSLTGNSILVDMLISWKKLDPDKYMGRMKKIRDEIEGLPSGKSFDANIHSYFYSVTERSVELLEKAQRRPNTLLFVGTIIAGLGLIFFIATLLGFLLPSSPLQPLTERMLDLIPRILMLAFIQLLAGFFLRQYRNSMEELRYYDTIARMRESQLIGYLILLSVNGANLQEFAKELTDTKEKDSIRLQQGETTMIIEAQKSERNEFKSIIEMAFDLFRWWSRKKDSPNEGPTA